MINIKKKLILAVALITVCGVATSKAYAIENKERIYGNDRYQTAIAVSQDGWKSSDTVILANGENFPDALCAAPLARKYKAPILLTPSASLDTRVESEIKRLGSKKIIIVGGAGVVSQATESKLKSRGIEVSRFAGKDRFETSLAIAREAKGTGSEIAVVSSEGFADALSVAPIAANKQMPIILLPKNNIPNNINQYIKDNNITKTYVIGGKGVLPDSLISVLPGFERVSGLNRYATNTAVLDRFASDINFETTYMASGENFPDALACSALAPVTSSPIILVSKYVPDNTMNLVKDKYNNINNFKVIGGTAVISDAVVRRMIPSFGIESGNTSSNLTNFGLAVESNGWIYYTNQSDYQRIYKMKIGDTKGQKLSDDPYASHLNVIGDWIYYADSEGGLCRMKTDGSELSLLTDYPVNFIQATSDYIYFLTSYKGSTGYQLRELHRIKPDGSSDEILYSYLSSDWDYSIIDNDIYFLYWNSSTQSNILKKGSYNNILNNVDKFLISGNHIYYINHEDKCIYKADMDGKNIVKVTNDTAKSLNVANGWIYYANTSDNSKLYKITIDGKDKSKVADFKIDSAINIAGGKIFYIETNRKYETYIMNKDGTAKTKSLIGKSASFASEANEYYYVNMEDSFIYRTDSNGNNIINLNHITKQNVQVSDGWIYYSNLNDNNKLYKMKTDGSSNIKVSDSSSGDFKLSGEYLYYVNMSDNNYIYKIKTDGTENSRPFYKDTKANKIWLKNNYLVFTEVPKYSDGDGTTVENTWTYVFDISKEYAFPERLAIPGNVYNLSIINDTIYYDLIEQQHPSNIETYNITDKSRTSLNITSICFTADETGIYYLSTQKDSLGYIIKADLKGNNPIKTEASSNAINFYINDNKYLYQTIDLNQIQYISSIN